MLRVVVGCGDHLHFFITIISCQISFRPHEKKAIVMNTTTVDPEMTNVFIVIFSTFGAMCALIIVLFVAGYVSWRWRRKRNRQHHLRVNEEENFHDDGEPAKWFSWWPWCRRKSRHSEDGLLEDTRKVSLDHDHIDERLAGMHLEVPQDDQGRVTMVSPHDMRFAPAPSGDSGPIEYSVDSSGMALAPAPNPHVVLPGLIFPLAQPGEVPQKQ